MSLFALSPEVTDFYTAGGFWVGAVSFVVGVAAFVIAIVQIREARAAAEASKTAAEAAREAAEKVLAESKDAYERFVGAFGSRLLSELETAVRGANWPVARFRCTDLAELIASLPPTAEPARDRLADECAWGLRGAAADFGDLDARHAAKPPKALSARWAATLRLVQARLDELRRPFRGDPYGRSRDSDTAGGAPGDGPRAARPNPGAAGELGAGRDPPV